MTLPHITAWKCRPLNYHLHFHLSTSIISRFNYLNRLQHDISLRNKWEAGCLDASSTVVVPVVIGRRL